MLLERAVFGVIGCLDKTRNNFKELSVITRINEFNTRGYKCTN